MNPPRPTPARLRSLHTKIERMISDIDAMTRGNTHSSDSVKLAGLRSIRTHLLDGSDWLGQHTKKEK